MFISPHKFIGGPQTPGVLVVEARAARRTRVPAMPGRRHRRVRQRRASTATSTDPVHARGGRHAGDHRVDPRRARVPAQGGGRRRRDPRARGRLHPARDRVVVEEPEHRDPRQPAARGGCRSCRSSCATGARTCTTTSSSRCSTICSASRRAAAAACAGPYGHRLLGIDLDTQQGVRARDRARLRGHQARLGARQLQLLPVARRSSSSSSTRSTWSRTTAGGCCRTTASTPTPASGATATHDRAPT